MDTIGMTSTRLVNRGLRQFDSKLAKWLGLNEAILLQQIHYWLQKNAEDGRNLEEGRYWTYNSVENWIDTNFEWWSQSTLKRAIKSLKTKGILVTGCHNKAGFDRTVWYSIDYAKLNEIELAGYAREGQDVTGSDRTCKRMNSPLGQNEPMDAGNTQTVEQQQLTMNQASGHIEPSIGSSCTTHRVKMNQTIPESNTETSSQRVTYRTVPYATVKQTLDLINKPGVIDYILSENAVCKSSNTDLQTALSVNGHADHPKFAMEADTAQAIARIIDGLEQRELPTDPVHIATAIIHGYSSDSENGRGKSMVSYIHRYGCGLTLRPFVVLQGNARHSRSLVDETLESANIAGIAPFMRDHFMDPTPELLKRLEEESEFTATLRKQADVNAAKPWLAQEREAATG